MENSNKKRKCLLWHSSNLPSTQWIVLTLHLNPHNNRLTGRSNLDRIWPPLGHFFLNLKLLCGTIFLLFKTFHRLHLGVKLLGKICIPPYCEEFHVYNKWKWKVFAIDCRKWPSMSMNFGEVIGASNQIKESCRHVKWRRMSHNLVCVRQHVSWALHHRFCKILWISSVWKLQVSLKEVWGMVPFHSLYNGIVD